MIVSQHAVRGEVAYRIIQLLISVSSYVVCLSNLLSSDCIGPRISVRFATMKCLLLIRTVAWSCSCRAIHQTMFKQYPTVFRVVTCCSQPGARPLVKPSIQYCSSCERRTSKPSPCTKIAHDFKHRIHGPIEWPGQLRMGAVT